MLNICPVCTEQIETASLTLYQKHVSGHFNDPIQTDQEISDLNDSEEANKAACQDDSRSLTDKAIMCPVCVCSIGDLQVEERTAHIASHFEEVDHESSQEVVSSAFRKPNFARPTSKRDRRDVSWSFVHSSLSSLPPNYTPNLIPTLYQVLSDSVETRSAVLCFSHGTTHIRSRRGWDSTWGCGFRNFQMCFSALSHPLAPGGGIDDGEGVSVWTLQGWIEDAWREGFDEVGKSQFKGKMRGVKRWIGAADIWVGLMCTGIRCRLYDFPKASSPEDQPSHVVLQRWVVNYFNSDDSSSKTTEGGSAFNMMTESQGDCIRISNKLPLILQHQGHSRTVIGYETLSSGDTNLLLFDPAKTVPEHLRRLAIEELKANRENSSLSSKPSPVGKKIGCGHPLADDMNVGPKFRIESKPPRNPNDDEGSEVAVDQQDTIREQRSHKSRSRMPSSSFEGEETDNGVSGKKRRARALVGNRREKRWRKDAGAALNCFRVNLKTLKRNSEYQILAFSGGPVLSQEERDKHKVVVSTKVSK